MNIETIIKNSLVNFDGKVAIYYDDLHGNILSINEKEIYNAASCIKIFILIGGKEDGQVWRTGKGDCQERRRKEKRQQYDALYHKAAL